MHVTSLVSRQHYNGSLLFSDIGDRTCGGSVIGLNEGSTRIMSFLSRVARVIKRKRDVSEVLLIVPHSCSRCCSRQSKVVMFSITTLSYVECTKP
jgi:hypothetical protein